MKCDENDRRPSPRVIGRSIGDGQPIKPVTYL